MCSKENLEEKVKSLYEVMQEEKVEEIRINSSDMKLHIKRKNLSKPQPVMQIAKTTTIADTKQEIDVPKEQTEVSGNTIKSPITGIFYRSPSPSSPMFIKEGDIVDAGKTMCIIEAMKVMNEIKATEKVKIVKILIENGQSINAQQDLFVVEKM